MKNWKRALVVCGVVGLLALLVPFSGRSLLLDDFRADRLAALVHAAIFVLPLAMGAIGLARPPMQAWQSGVALAGCVLGVVRFHLWELVLHLGSTGVSGALLAAALVVGMVASVATLVRPEP
ncbi:MAG TPA: hypothetical protein VGD37_31915 [Kofleriaceae bacterium]